MRLGTVEKTIPPAGVVVVICTKVRKDGSEERAKIYLDDETVSLAK